jgi:hypothetical protein
MGQSNVIASIEIFPPMAAMTVGQTKFFSALARNINGDEIEGVEFEWYFDSEAAFLIAPGELFAFGQGTGILRAQSPGGKYAEVPVIVIVGEDPLAISACAAGCTQCVTSTGWGAGSLRNAINAANAAAGHDIICFDSAMAGPITPATPGTLPDVTDSAGLTLDMTTDALGREYRLTQNGWKICSSNNVIKGVTFTAITSAYALSLDASGGGGCQTTVSNNLIELNDFGTYRNDSSGEAANNLGILITSGATNNTIRNNFIVNRAAAQPAIRITGAATTGNAIVNNLIGVNRTGTAAFAKPNAFHGVEITGGAKTTLSVPAI